jgi:hypothetical protein
MSLDYVLNRFKLLSGLDDCECESWLSVIREAVVYVRKLVDYDNLSAEEQSCVENAAGVYAFYQFACASYNRESSFSAGDLSVKYSSDVLQHAKAMWEEEQKSLSVLSKQIDSSFVFERM